MPLAPDSFRRAAELGLETFGSEHEVFDTIYYYRGAARSATNI